MIPAILTVVAVGYLLGSLPFGYLVARAHGVDIFKEGSKSSGATNVKRTCGSRAAAIVLFLDALKGAAATAVPVIFRMEHEYLGAAGLFSAVLGHGFSCFTGFRGGKGVATGAGGFAVLFPIGMLIALGIWGLSLGITRFVSLASVVAALSLPITALARSESRGILGVSVVVAIFVIYKHRANVGRIFAGTEPRIGKGGSPGK